MSSNQDKFFVFQSELEQSALYYTNVAMRQMRIGYQNQVGGTTVPNGIPTTSRHSNSSSGVCVIPHSCSRQCYPDPPVINVTMDGFEGVDYGKLTTVVKGVKGIRKVNFAHPLSMIKVKSPTPMHSLEDFGSAFIGAAATATEMGPIYSESDARGDDNETVGNLADDNDSAYGNSLVWNLIGENGNGNSRHRRRKRRKKRRSGEHDDQFEGGSTELDNSSVPNFDLNEDDPYAIYEVPLNEEDYEFISEVRLCTEHDLTKDEDSDSVGSGKEWDSTPEEGAVGGEGDEAVLKEMEQLYGEIGSQRITKMEEALETYFRKVAMENSLNF